MSNLLKKQAEDEISTFGFPVIETGEEDTVFSLGDDIPEPDPLHSEPEVSTEEVFRKKLLELERRTQEIERDAYAKGFAQGEKDGLEYGQKTVQVIKTQLERIAEGLDSLPNKIFSDYRDWLITYCLKVARRVVRRELATSPEIVAGVINNLLDEAEEHSSLTVYLHPLDVEFMEKRADLLLGVNAKHLTIKADADLERGGCRVESEVQLFDASLDSQFEELERQLLKKEEPGDVAGMVADAD